MKTCRFNKFLHFLLIICLSACSSTGKLTKRYKSFLSNNVSEGIKSNVLVSGYTVEGDAIEVPKPKTIFDLAPEAQKELIKQLSSHEPVNDKLISLIASPLSAKASSSIEVIDYTRFQKRLVISVKKQGFAPASRIGKIEIDLRFSDAVKLLSCNRLATEYQNVDLGKLNYSNTLQGTVTGNLTSGLTSVLSSGGSSTRTLVNSEGNTIANNSAGTSGTAGNSNTDVSGNTYGLTSTANETQGLSASLTGSRTFAEEVLLKQRIVDLQVSIVDNVLTLYQEGISGIDLSGNIIADVTFELKKDIATKRIISFSELSPSDGIYNRAPAIKIKETLVYYPNLNNSIGAKISYYAEYRSIMKGDNTISESDDVVTLNYGRKPEDSTFVGLIPVEQLKPKMWKLYLSDDTNKTPVQIYTPSTGGNGDLIFNSANESRNFMLWLKAKYNTLLTNGGLGNVGHKITLPKGIQINTTNIQKLTIGIYR